MYCWWCYCCCCRSDGRLSHHPHLQWPPRARHLAGRQGLIHPSISMTPTTASLDSRAPLPITIVRAQGLYLNEHRDYGGSRRVIVTIQGQIDAKRQALNRTRRE